MKKLILLIGICFFSYISFSQDRELSDYEKYKMEQEKERFSKDTIREVDTIYIETKAPATIINNYYDYDYDYSPRYGRFFISSYYPSYYWDRWYYDSYYPYSYYRYYSYHTPHYRNYHNYYRYYYYSHNNGIKYASSNTLGSKRNYYYQPHKTYSNGYVSYNHIKKESITRTAVKQSPTYKKPTPRTQHYNVYKPTTSLSRSTYNRPVRSTNYSRPSSSTTYAPSKSSSSNYSRSSAPTRSSSSYTRSSSGISRSSSGTIRSSSSSNGKRK